MFVRGSESVRATCRRAVPAQACSVADGLPPPAGIMREIYTFLNGRRASVRIRLRCADQRGRHSLVVGLRAGSRSRWSGPNQSFEGSGDGERASERSRWKAVGCPSRPLRTRKNWNQQLRDYRTTVSESRAKQRRTNRRSWTRVEPEPMIISKKGLHAGDRLNRETECGMKNVAVLNRPVEHISGRRIAAHAIAAEMPVSGCRRVDF